MDMILNGLQLALDQGIVQNVRSLYGERIADRTDQEVREAWSKYCEAEKGFDHDKTRFMRYFD